MERAAYKGRVFAGGTMESVSVYDRFMIWAYRTLAVGCVVGLVANVYKHGWSLSGMIWPILLSTLLFSLGTNPARRSTAWLVRYIVAVASESESTRIVRWRRWALWAWPLLLIILTFLRRHFLTSRLDASNLYPTFWRIVYLRSGVSPLLPQVLLLVGLYAWFWFSLQGLSLFGADRPMLPRRKDLPEFDVGVAPRTRGFA